MEKAVKCGLGHKPEIVCGDLSQAYHDEKFKKMFQVRCKTPHTCHFSDHFFNKSDAIKSWNIAIEEGR